MASQPANTRCHSTPPTTATLIPADYDLDIDFDDEVPIVLQVLEGVEVEEMPDIHVEREPVIYMHAASETEESNRLGEFKRTLEAAEKKAAEMESAEHVVEYRPWRIDIKNEPSSTSQNCLEYYETSFSPPSSPSIRPDTAAAKTWLEGSSKELQVEIVAAENGTGSAGMPKYLEAVTGRETKSKLPKMSLCEKARSYLQSMAEEKKAKAKAMAKAVADKGANSTDKTSDAIGR